MTAANGKLRVFPPLEGDRLLGLGDGGRGSHHHPEDDAAPRGDSPQDAAAVVPLGNTRPASMRKGSLAWLPRRDAKPNPAPKAMPFTAGMLNISWESTLSTLSKKGAPSPAGRPSIRHSSTPPTLSCSARAARMAASICGASSGRRVGRVRVGKASAGVSPGSTGSRKLLSRMFSSCWIWHTAEMPCPARYCRHRAPANTRGAVSRALKCPPPRKSSKP